MQVNNHIDKIKQITEHVSLRMFLMLRSKIGKWQSIVCSNPDDAVRVWKTEKKSAQDAGVLHIGFEQPSFQELERIVDQYLGRMLITITAKYTLPTSFVTSKKPIAWTEDFAVYLALQGWGYSLQDHSEETNELSIASQDWLLAYIKENPRAAEILNKLQIYNDTSYRDNEHHLDPPMRRQLGIYRTRYLIGKNCKDPCAFARAAPPWLMQQKLIALNITTKARNAFKEYNIETVADLATWTSQRLLKKPLLGYKSLYSAWVCLNNSVNDIPLSDTENRKVDTNHNLGFLKSLQQFLLSLNNREHYVFTRRLGFKTPPQSLQCIADDCGLIAELVRKLEIKSIKKLKHNALWNIFEQKITHIFDNANYPLTVIQVAVADPWFTGITKHREFFKNLVAIMNNKDTYIVKIGKIYYFSPIQQSLWNDLLKQAQKLLRSGMDNRWSETEAYLCVQKLLPDSAKSMNYLLWHRVSKSCLFQTDENGIRIFIHYGGKLSYQVKKILDNSETPLHYKKVTEIINHRYGENLPALRVLSATSDVGLLFARGTYGLTKHISIPKNRMTYLRQKIEVTVQAKYTKRLWSGDELLSTLSHKDKIINAVDKYMIGIILSDSELLKYHRRMHWKVI